MFQDKLKNSLAIGDTVAYVYLDYPDVRIGNIVGFTAKKVRIALWDEYTTLKDPQYVLKVTIPHA